MERTETDWRTILLLLGAAGGALLAYGIAASILIYASFEAASPQPAAAGRSAFEFIVLAGAPLVIGTVFLPAVYYSIRRLLGRAAIPAAPKVLRIPQAVVLVLVWAAAAAGAGLLFDKPVAKWITPALYVLAIGVPVYFFVRLATGGLHPGSRQRLWGVLTTGIGLGIVPAILVELMLVLVVFVLLVFYLALDPAQLATFESLAHQLQDTTDMGQVLNAVGPMLTSPIALLLALLFFSGLSPLIEETAKSLATWTVFDRLTSASQGFAVGAISGAAFGLVESLLVSAQPDASWATTLLVRGASTMMHIMSASLTGWGIGRFRVTRRFLPLLGMYLAAMALHGLWNASVVAITFGTIRSSLASGGRDPVGIILIFVGAATLVVLCLAIPLGMWAINRRFRKVASAAPGSGGATEAQRQSELTPVPVGPLGVQEDGGDAAEPRSEGTLPPPAPLP